MIGMTISTSSPIIDTWALPHIDTNASITDTTNRVSFMLGGLSVKLSHMHNQTQQIDIANLRITEVDISHSAPSDITGIVDGIGIEGNHKEPLILACNKQGSRNTVYLRYNDDIEHSNHDTIDRVSQIIWSPDFMISCQQVDDSHGVLNVTDHAYRSMPSYTDKIKGVAGGLNLDKLFVGLQRLATKIYYIRHETYRSQLVSLDSHLLTTHNISTFVKCNNVACFNVDLQGICIFDSIKGLIILDSSHKRIIVSKYAENFDRHPIYMTSNKIYVFCLMPLQSIYDKSQVLSVLKRKTLKHIDMITLPETSRYTLCKMINLSYINAEFVVVYLPGIAIISINALKSIFSVVFTQNNMTHTIRNVTQVIGHSQNVNMLGHAGKHSWQRFEFKIVV